MESGYLCGHILVRTLINFKTILSPFFFILLLMALLFNVQSVKPAMTSFSWLKPGVYAVYSFPDVGDSLPSMLDFDDLGQAYPIRGNYSWLCLEKNDTHTVLSVEVNIEVFHKPELTNPGAVTYEGIEFLERAENGDLSFIKRVPMDQVVGRVELRDFPEDGWYAVRIPSPIIISQNFTVVVDLDTMMMINENGQPWGKWILWIDPLKYPLEGRTEEPFVMNWLNTTINLNVTYQTSLRIETALGETKRYFAASCYPPIENDFLLNLRSNKLVIISYIYESRTGIFLKPTTSTYLDDVLTQKLGIAKTLFFPIKKNEQWTTLFYLNETNITIEESAGGFDLTPYIVYLAIPAIAATATAAYIIKKKTHKKKNEAHPRTE